MRRFLFTNCTLLHKELFVVGALGGLPAKINLHDGRINFYHDMKGFIVNQDNIIIDFMECFLDDVYALDSSGKNLIIFDLKKCQCRYMPLNCSNRKEMNFAAFERYRSEYYIFPRYQNKILVFHIEKRTVTEIEGCLNSDDEIQCTCRVEDNVWVLPRNENRIYRYDLSKKMEDKYELKKTIQNCIHAVYKDGNIYILNKFGIIYVWNIKKHELSIMGDLETDHNEKLSMSRIIYAGQRLILLPAYGKDIKILDLPTKKVQIYHNYPEDYYDQTVWLRFYGYCEDEKCYYFAMCASNYLLMIEKESGKLIWTKIEPLGPKAIQIYCESGHAVFNESRFREITELIKILPENKYRNDETGIGRKIYTEMGKRKEDVL